MMSLRTVLGRRPRLCADDSSAPVTLLELSSPVVSEEELEGIRSQSVLQIAELECICPESSSLAGAIEEICRLAEAAVKGGAELLVLSDTTASPAAPPIPMAMVVGAVHHHLINIGLRTHCDLIA
jgi:hypothetical protein